MRKKVPEPLIAVGQYPPQQRWPSGSVSATFPTCTAEEEEEREEYKEGIKSSQPDFPPNIPPKDPGRLPYSRSSSLVDYSSNQPYSTPLITAPTGPLSSEHQGAQRGPTWEKAPRPPNHYHNPSSDQPPQYQAFQPAPSSASSTSSHPLPLRSSQETAYQHQQGQVQQNSRPPSQQSYEPPSPSQPQFRGGDLQYHLRARPQDTPASTYSESMGPPPSAHQNQRVADTATSTQLGTNREGYPYGQSGHAGQGGNQATSQTGSQYGSQLAVNSQQGPNYRGTPQPSPMAPQNSTEGRHSPPPSRSRDDLASLDVQQLLSRHDELRELLYPALRHTLDVILICIAEEKYRKVKKYYFDKDGQVQQLQNTLAHQRLSQSRTSLDDNEYANRFTRLDGAITNLAFNIRREWRCVPPWLAPHVNKDATTTVTKEMTAVGRACICRWVIDEIFDRYFHPALETNLSSQLKIIEKNLRRFASPATNEEERDALVARISNWRLTTLDGLQEMMHSQLASEYRATLTESLVEKLTASLMMNLKEPPPLGLDAGVIGIIELAVGIAANLPLESRDVFVEYVMPGTLVNESYMKVETGLPALTNPGEGVNDAAERSSIVSADLVAGEKDEGDRDSVKDIPMQGQQGPQQPQATTQQQSQQQNLGQKKKGMFGGLMGKKPAPSTSLGDPQRVLGVQTLQAQQQLPKEDRVRFASFMAVEVRGRSVLLKAPVYI